MTFDIREAEIASGVPKGELLVIEAEQMKKRRVQIVHVDLLLRGCEAEIVG